MDEFNKILTRILLVLAKIFGICVLLLLLFECFIHPFLG